MAKISANTAAMLFAAACIAMLVPTGLAQLRPASPLIQIPGLLPPVLGDDKCWKLLTAIPGCLMEIFGSFSSGQIGKIGPSCCNAINQVSDNCWPNMFPVNPFFPSLLKNFCAAPSPQIAGKNNAAGSKIYSPRLLPVPPVFNETEITECWSSFTNIEGCALEIYKSLTSGLIVGIGPACCKAVTEINNKCWPKMFPFNPFFPPLLKNTCAKVTGVAPTPTPTAI